MSQNALDFRKLNVLKILELQGRNFFQTNKKLRYLKLVQNVNWYSPSSAGNFFFKFCFQVILVELHDPQHPQKVFDIKNIENAISLEHTYETRKFGKQSAGINSTNPESVSTIVITAIGL